MGADYAMGGRATNRGDDGGGAGSARAQAFAG